MKRRSFLSALGMAPAVAAVASLPAPTKAIQPETLVPSAAKSVPPELELLATLQDKRVPIPMRTWMAAAKIDPDALARDLMSDPKLVHLHKLGQELGGRQFMPTTSFIQSLLKDA